MNIQPVILCGGAGSRLWPLSREHYPKQLMTLYGNRSLLQNTLLRLEGLDKRIADGMVLPPLIVANEEHRFLVAEQLRQIDCIFEKIILEPFGRNTAPALTLAALAAQRGGQDPLLMAMPADHIIHDVVSFQQTLIAGVRLAEKNHIVVFGVMPDYPECGYGYIKRGEPLSDEGFCVTDFVEKPDLATAEQYLKSGQYLWNSGMLMVRASLWLRAIAMYQPAIALASKAAFDAGSEDMDFYRIDKKLFDSCPSDSIDFAVMEKIPTYEMTTDTVKAAVLPLGVVWSDVGSWESLWKTGSHDENGNVIKGDVYTLATRNSLLISGHRIIAVAGIEDMVVIETADAVMVARRNQAQEVKKLVALIKKDGSRQYQSHRHVYRPWGHYELIDSGERFQVKRVTVNPGAALSLQLHQHRAEHWVVVKGGAKVTSGEQTIWLTENQSTYIPTGVKHRLENPGTIPLELIEVQSGSYLGEDDIIRFEDAYGR